MNTVKIENMSEIEFRNKILGIVKDYANKHHSKNLIQPGIDMIPVSGKVYDAHEMTNLVDASLDFWLTTGRYNEKFQKSLSNFLNIKHAMTTNSGSSANLLALSALTSHIHKDKALKPGDEVITVAAGFPTTVNPIIQNGLVPVFIDVELATYNVQVDLIESAISEKTRAIMLAHTLGNPFDLDSVLQIVNKYDLWLIEDCCDALGSTYKNKYVGGFGDVATCSFYPAHHITMGEGGAVLTNNGKLKRVIDSFRDWGRDCHCDPGQDNTCGKRFNWKLGDLPLGYDHKYIYSHTGYNLKITDMQAAIACAQIDKLPSFIEARKNNFSYLKSRLSALDEYLILPEATQNSDPSWFGFPITIRDKDDRIRPKLLEYLERNKIATRLIFAGNITKQPYFKNIEYRLGSDLENTDMVMNNSFWVGIYPRITNEALDYIADTMERFFNGL